MFLVGTMQCERKDPGPMQNAIFSVILCMCLTVGVAVRPTAICPVRLRYLQTTPFGRGFQKAVWLVKQVSPSDRDPCMISWLFYLFPVHDTSSVSFVNDFGHSLWVKPLKVMFVFCLLAAAMPDIMVVKRAPDVTMVTETGADTSTPLAILKKRFAGAFQQELRRLIEFEHNAWVMKLYGWCSKPSGDSYYVVEPLSPLAPVLWSPLK